jgi:hypothetical protein
MSWDEKLLAAAATRSASGAALSEYPEQCLVWLSMLREDDMAPFSISQGTLPVRIEGVFMASCRSAPFRPELPEHEALAS